MRHCLKHGTPTVGCATLAQMSSRSPRALLVGGLAAVVALAAQATGLLERPEAALVDQRYSVRGSEAPRDVVVVGIDEDDLARLGRQWPLPRSLHARAIDALRRAGARTIAYDVQFSEPSSPRQDRALLRAAGRPGVVLGTAELTADGQPAVIGGIRALEAHGGAIGYANFPVDADGAIRDMEARVDGVPLLAVVAAGASPGAGRHPIDFAGPPGTVPEVSFADVVGGRFDRHAIRGKIAVVGATAPSLHDDHATAVGHLMSGAELQANAVETALRGYPLEDAPGVIGVLLTILAAMLAPLATLAGRPARAVVQALATGLLGTIALAVGAQLAFDAGAIVPLATPLLALGLGTAGAVAATYATEVRTRRRVRAAFERFVPPTVVDEILRREGASPRLESRRLDATVMFCDLRGFTTLAEQLDAEHVIALLNRYLDEISGAVFDHGGTVVSYQGDGVLAVFGAPIEMPDHAARALAAAREIRDARLPRFNTWLKSQKVAPEPLRVGVGLNTGPVMSGSVGSDRRLEYAAVGDTTNVACRLQALSRGTPECLFVSAATREAAGSQASELRPYGEVMLPGRSKPIEVYAA
jgi:adenylate cyclase